jgi:hypothetical protein
VHIVKHIISISVIVVFGIFSPMSTLGQNPSTAQFGEMGTNLWVGSYNKFRIGEKLIWDAQHHYRRGGYNDIPFVGRMAQLYNRHALTYIFNKNFNATAGAVLRLDWTPRPGDETIENMILEPRFWHEYMFIMPFNRFMVYHRIRIEHRWTRGFEFDSDWSFRNRWRYKFYMAIPINKPKLVPGAFYFVPDIEIIMQSGNIVVDNPLEDLRIYPQLGYIVNPRLKIGGGPMYTTGQMSNPSGAYYRQRIVLRINAYISLDFRKFESVLPPINFND